MTNRFKSFAKEIQETLLHTFLPTRCPVCHTILPDNEPALCEKCFKSLPFTHLKGKPRNYLERKLTHGNWRTGRADALYLYYDDSIFVRPIHRFKYNGQARLAQWFGKQMALNLQDEGFFDGIDFIVPVPLSRQRLRKRGYNQSECLARGISLITSIPVCTEIVSRIKDNISQTHFNALEREENARNIFHLDRPDLAQGHHLLLVDDVCTTGSTLFNLALTISPAENVTLSFLALALNPSLPIHSAPIDEDELRV
ncbi:MAG: ComF family protein [Alloprevotella sp.]